ncbi:MAG: membrane protein insertase YidC [Proteobacteria bacterium]|nr:membrane protein insertase YidC [Pseudomonadota bacterium]
MDNPRLFLWIGLALLAWMNIIQWDRDYGSQPAVASATTAAPGATSTAAAPAVGTTPSSLPSLPSAAAPAAGTTAAAAVQTPAIGAVATDVPTIRVVTDVLDMDISLQGGDLLRADLLKYPQDKKPGSPAVRLLSTDDTTFSVVRSGLRAADGRAEPTHLATYTAPATEFRLAPGAQELRVPLTWTDGQGVTVMKTYVFRPGQYAIDVQYDVQNASTADWKAASYVQFARHVYSQKRSMFDVESYAFRGPAVYDGNKYQKLTVDKDDAAFRAPLRVGRRAAEGRDLRFLAAT